jgi:hypothetical protein
MNLKMKLANRPKCALFVCLFVFWAPNEAKKASLHEKKFEASES